MTLLRHITRCNAHDISQYQPLMVGPTLIGFVPHDLARRLADFPACLQTGPTGLRLSDRLDSAPARTAAIAEMADRLAQTGDVRSLEGETYAATAAWGQPALFTVDRALVPPLGLRAFGLHVNGIVDDGGEPADMRLWIGRRAADRRIAPGKLDNLIAGGQPHGLSLAQNLAKEAAEEAGFDAATVSRARPAGAITYTMAQSDGLRRDTLFIYDLLLPEGLRPRNQDGEVEDFFCMPVTEVATRVRDTDDFKFNVALVIIDFLIRQGVLNGDDPDYLTLATGLRR